MSERGRGRLTGKTAIVTGGARGLGAGIAQRLAAEGAHVLIGDVRTELGEEVAAELRAGGARALFVHLDVTDEESWARAVATAEAELGPVDVLVNNAFSMTLHEIEHETLEGWERTLAVTLTGPFLGMRAVVPGMRERGRGSIVNVSSTHGGDVAVPGLAAYQAAKGGLSALTRNVAIAYARDGIRANAVHPGPIRTPIIEELGFTETQASIAAGLPIGRVAEPAEVAAAVAYLASDEASFATGSSLVVDGGYTAL